jgi:hypothetical protein
MDVQLLKFFQINCPVSIGIQQFEKFIRVVILARSW